MADRASVSFALSREEQWKKTELMGRTWQTYATLCDRIDRLNATLDAEREAMKATLGDYAEALVALRHFAADVSETHDRSYHQKLDHWRTSEEALTVRFWIEAYGGFEPGVPVVACPERVRYPTENMLTRFEELPDEP
jgi:hypothetical protein